MVSALDRLLPKANVKGSPVDFCALYQQSNGDLIPLLSWKGGSGVFWLAGRQTEPAPPESCTTTRLAVQARLPGPCSARPVQDLTRPTRLAMCKAGPVQGAALALCLYLSIGAFLYLLMILA
jgi:hypothetical protein